ncbi:phage tail-collar fiber domain-containing protein [Acinetobacter sp. 102]|uniref:phage tail-collar fiber domain-containing protein n=1 Tax=Acinetobacter sp. 102 TaxID=3098766 RepID=UPI0030085112
MTYKSIHTTIGLQRLAQAEATGSQIHLTHFAVGDGGGYPIDVNQSMFSLVREQYRGQINRIFQNPENENLFTAEVIVPVTVGSFVMREIGIFDNNGNLIIVGNLPDVHKPTATEGAFTDSVFRIPFMVSNADTVELRIDPNVVQATHSWVINTLTPAFLIPGGTTGQVLKKTSNVDGAFTWSDPGSTNVFVRSVEEQQLLTEGQTAVSFTTVTTTGLAVYVDGIRIPNRAGSEGWTVTNDTQINLGKSYPANAKILGVQNEPLGGFPYPLAHSANLADVPNKAEARQNLNVFSKDEVLSNTVPPGTIFYFAGSAIPPGYRAIKANGAAISRTAYPDLFSVIGTTYGAGDGVSTFNLPDCRGEFIRALDEGRGVDWGRELGTRQSQQVQRHKHLSLGEAYPAQLWPFGSSIKLDKMGTKGGLDYDNRFFYTNDGTDYDDAKPNALGVIGDETRPRNIAFLACIKY